MPVFLYSIAVCTCNTSCSYSSTDHWLVSWLGAKVASLRDLFGLRSPAVFIVVLTSIQLFQSLSARVSNLLLEIKRCLCGFTIIILEVYQGRSHFLHKITYFDLFYKFIQLVVFTLPSPNTTWIYCSLQCQLVVTITFNIKISYISF